MGIFDLFTGGALKDAAEQNRGVLQGAQNNVGNLADITRRYNEDVLRGAYGDARNNLATGYNAATGAINQGATGALGYLDQGSQGAIDALRGAYSPLSDLASRYGAGSRLYSDALGINGPEGNARAVSAYQRGPGYEAGLNSGLDAIARQANAAGRGFGGNVLQESQKFGQDYQNQDYNKFLDRLSGFNPLELSATSGAAAGNAGIANILNSTGQNKAQISTGQAGNLADLASRYYGGQSQNDIGLGSAIANNMSATNGWNVNAQLGLAPKIGQTYVDAANAEMTGAKNAVGLGLSLASLAAGGAGGLGGGSSFLPSKAFMNNSWGW